MKILILSILALPLFFSLLLFVVPQKWEKVHFWILTAFTLIYGFVHLILLIFLALFGIPKIEWDIYHPIVYEDYEMKYSLFIDGYALAYQLLIGALAVITFHFSKRYMIGEKGRKRFFITLMVFLFGISTVALSNTISVLYAGWEIVGIASYLLIGFYSHRKNSGKNALTSYAIYRLCDVGLFLGAWVAHEFGQDLTFFALESKSVKYQEIIEKNPFVFSLIGLLTLFAAMGKSAQYPFSFWLPRAMEGPTPSSAIFYGALSVHAGVFLLIRTFPIWEKLYVVRFSIGLVGFISLTLASLSAKAQSNIKGQIGYATVAQVGVMFVELALGLREVALWHALGNATLRAYQLLASPSVLVIFLRLQNEMLYRPEGVTNFLLKFVNQKVKSIITSIALGEGFASYLLDKLQNILVLLSKFSKKILSYEFVIFLLAFLLSAVILEDTLKGILGKPFFAIFLGIISLKLALWTFWEKQNPKFVINNITLSSLFMGISTLLYSESDYWKTWLFFSGLAIGFLLCRIALTLLKVNESFVPYPNFGEKYPKIMLLFFLGILNLIGFPFLPTFFGEDLLLHYAAKKFLLETFFIAGIFTLNGFILMRLFTEMNFGKN